MNDDQNDPSEEQRSYPWDDVEAARYDLGLQKRHAAHRPVGFLKPCPSCQTPANQLTLIYFRSPGHTWRELCGTEGWMTICDPCHLQVEYREEALS